MNLNLLLFFFTLLSLAGLVESAPTTAFYSAKNVLQRFAKDMYPNEPAQQAKAVVTLRYLFRNDAWNEVAHWPYMDDYLRTGGFQQGYSSVDQVLVQSALSHLQGGTVYTPLGAMRPSLDALIAKNFSKAKNVYGFDQHELLRETNLGRKPPTSGAGLFAGVPRALSLEDAESLVGNAWRRGGSGGVDEQRRIRGNQPSPWG
ncbi:uncharacterized protein UMAG_02851 [Mycosarcoma maydis]|uniref:Uncharacterized protein n=1 Tax=Mycosarcoma maydis TaxID=5270 RepID=A0A0D1CQH8_MYCMD|nr:uncharacterized protein UMAG_02851 [Ustilago maydis 521]KIS68863.1 hypothetical protein UMAG_02851 [Ustilago maydis 521]|eukprot:XP_011389288.1 hypothetical protein UMAG_02851 [Ustilago maydis 521]